MVVTTLHVCSKLVESLHYPLQGLLNVVKVAFTTYIIAHEGVGYPSKWPYGGMNS